MGEGATQSASGPAGGGGLHGGPARTAAILAAILGLAAVARAVRWQHAAAIFNDGPIFLALAERFSDGRFSEALGHPFHPLYPAVVAMTHTVVPDLETAGVVVSVVAGTISVACMYAFVKQAFGVSEGLVAAFLLAVHPGAIEYAGDVQSEALYLALFLGCAASLWAGLVGRRTGALVLAGALGGAAYLTRPEGLGIVLVAGAGMLGAAALRPGGARRWVALGIALGLGCALVAGPYLLWLRIETGAFEISGKKSLAVVAGVREAPFQGADPLAANPQQPWVRDADDPAPGSPQARPPRPQPSRAAQAFDALFDTLQTHFRSLRYELAAILGVGFALTRPRPGRRAAWIGAVVLVYGLFLLMLRVNVGYVSGRHTLPTVTLLFGYVAIAALAIRDRVGRTDLARTAVLLGLLAIVAAIGLGKALKPSRLHAVAERQAAEWLSVQPGEHGIVAARKRRTAYYADAAWVKLASAAYPGGLRILGATHLILSDDDTRDYPKLDALVPPEARLVHQAAAHGITASVYDLWPGDADGTSLPELPPGRR